jgi:hypothetical protein
LRIFRRCFFYAKISIGGSCLIRVQF